MRIYSMERLDEEAAASGRPIVLSQKFSHAHRRVRAATLAGAGALLCLPLGLVLAHAPARARLIDLAISDPVAITQLVIVALIALAALGFGISELRRPIVRERLIELNDHEAVVEDVVGGRKQRWRAPVSSFQGIRHRVFTTSGGTIHTLLLEHAQPTRSLHIAYETHIAKQAIVDAARSYDLPILQSGTAKRQQQLADRFGQWFSLPGRAATQDSQTAIT